MSTAITQLEIQNNLLVSGQMNIIDKITGNDDLEIKGNIDISNNAKVWKNLDVSNNILANTIISNRNKTVYRNFVQYDNNDYVEIKGSALLIPRMHGTAAPNGRIDPSNQKDIAKVGMIVYDTEKGQYLGIADYEGQMKWTGLGGTISWNQQTRIEAYDDNDISVGGWDISGLHFFTHGKERMIIDKSGNIGVGTSYPTSSLSIISNKDNQRPNGNQEMHPVGCHLGQSPDDIAYLELCDASGCRIDFSDSSSNDFKGRIYYNNQYDSMTIYTASFEKIKILSDGKVRILNSNIRNLDAIGGIVDPTSALSIIGAKSGIASSYKFGCHLGQSSIDGGSTNGIGSHSYLELCNDGVGEIIFIKFDNTSGEGTAMGQIKYDYESGKEYMGFYNSANGGYLSEDNDILRITHHGNVEIRNPRGLTFSLDWDTDVNFKAALDVRGTIKCDSLACMGNQFVTGDVTTFYQSSDKRLKTNIETIKNPLDIVDKLRGVRFNWNEKVCDINKNIDLSRPEIGVIAQEIEDVLPEVIKNGLSGYKAVRYDKIVSLLIECIKEQQKQFKNQKNEIDSLQSQINELKTMFKNNI